MASSQRRKYIVGITGPFGSGKSTAASILKAHGYTSLTLSKPLEDEVRKRGLPVTRKNLQDVGNEWREEYGPGILVEKALLEAQDEEKIVVDGLRNIGEVEVLRKQKGSMLIAIIANREIRFKRAMRMKRRERLTRKLFDQLDARDLGIGEKKTGLQVAFCVALADVYVDSNKGHKEFKTKLSEIIQEYEK